MGDAPLSKEPETVFGMKTIIHETVQPGLLAAIGPCSCDHDEDCPRCHGLGIYGVVAKGLR